jgi:hypothetical protein
MGGTVSELFSPHCYFVAVGGKEFFYLKLKVIE